MPIADKYIQVSSKQNDLRNAAMGWDKGLLPCKRDCPLPKNDSRGLAAPTGPYLATTSKPDCLMIIPLPVITAGSIWQSLVSVVRAYSKAEKPKQGRLYDNINHNKPLSDLLGRSFLYKDPLNNASA